MIVLSVTKFVKLYVIYDSQVKLYAAGLKGPTGASSNRIVLLS